MPKSWLGFSSVKFFGYKVTYGKREMDEDRKKAIVEFQMPSCQKKMQSFLGAALFLKSFVPNYSGVAAELNKMTHKDFDWRHETWKYDYEADFNKMKTALSEPVANHFPDYNLDWVLRVDASDKAVGVVLYREWPDQFGMVHEPIEFASRKFSSIASRCIRFCGNYWWLNAYVLKSQAYIPRVQYEVEKAMGFKIFLDIDMTNSFHQFPLTEPSSQRLAI